MLLLSVQDNPSLLCSQFLARALQTSHVSHPLVVTPSGLKTWLENDPPVQVPWAASCHWKTTNRLSSPCTRRRSPGRSPPAPPTKSFTLPLPCMVTEEEKLLPRRHRFAISQLRSGYCSTLSSFLYSVNRAPDSFSPSYRGAPHSPAISSPAAPIPPPL